MDRFQLANLATISLLMSLKKSRVQHKKVYENLLTVASTRLCGLMANFFLAIGRQPGRFVL